MVAAASAGCFYASLAPDSTLFGRALTAPAKPGDFALTFDDGPNPAWTPQLLDLLAAHNVRATFFLVGQFAVKQRALARRVHDAGHLIGNHTWTHPNLARTGKAQTHNELADTNSELEQITGAPIRFFRPPFGLRRPATFAIARELGLTPVTWTVIGNDWKPLTAEEIAARVTSLSQKDRQRGQATNLVLHDGSHRTPTADRSRTIAAVSQFLPKLVKSHRFVTLDTWNRR